MTFYITDPAGTDDQAWFERPGAWRKRRVRPITDDERRQLGDRAAGSNFAVVSWIEPGLLAYNYIIVPDHLIDYVLAHDQCVVLDRKARNFCAIVEGGAS
jgi:hypothetical protein